MGPSPSIGECKPSTDRYRVELGVPCSTGCIITANYTNVDRNDGQFFKAMEWRWLFFSNDGMAMVFENSHHHHRWFLAGSTIGSDGFSMDFPILGTNGSRWLQTEIRDELRVNKTSKTEMQAIN